MRFKLQTDYGLRAMVYMAAIQANCTTDEIASYYDISSAHLGRVIRRLQSHGFVKAIRGRRGGVRLDRDPETVTLGEVVETLEQGAQPLDPPHGEPTNGIDENLRLKAVLRRAHGLFVNYLNKVTMADLASEGLPPKPQPQTMESSPSQHETAPQQSSDAVSTSPREPIGVPSTGGTPTGYGRTNLPY